MSHETITIIEARPQTLTSRLFALWQYRSFYGFLFKEITMRKFRDTLLGFWWLAIRPLIPAIVFIVMFTVHPMQSNNDLPYAIFFLSGYITWNLFNSTLVFMPRTLIWMQGIMRRTYFPRLLVPLAGFGPPLIEFLVLFAVFVTTIGYYWITQHHFPLMLSWHIVWILPCYFLALLFGITLGMFASIIALFFRDIVFSVSYIAQMLMILTPVIYPVSFIPQQYHWLLYTLNPMAKLVEVSRWALTGSGQFDPFFFSLSALTILFLFILSVTFFLRAESNLADQM